MKKFLLIAVLAVLGAVSAKAQVRLGGEVSVWYNNDTENTSYAFMPEIGYKLNDRWEVGTEIGFTGHSNQSGLNFKMAPFARYTFLRAGMFSMFGEGGFAVATSKHRDTAFNIGLRPGIDVELSEHWSLEAHLGFLGFATNKDGIAGMQESGFGFDFANGTSFALIYQF